MEGRLEGPEVVRWPAWWLKWRVEAVGWMVGDEGPLTVWLRAGLAGWKGREGLSRIAAFKV